MLAAQILFWSALSLLAYTYIGYPLLIRVLASMRPRPPRKAPMQPMISILVVAHDEEDRIARRIENLLALDYPRDRMEIVIASDASRDATVERARSYAGHGVQVVEFQPHRGKPAVLNDMVPRLGGDIVVLLDVRQRIEPGALRALAANFADAGTGAVSGELILDGAGSEVGEGVGFYWRYEKYIRFNESLSGSTVGVTGAIYAIRRRLFTPIPQDTILDDVLIPLQIARQGYRVLFEPAARAHDRVYASAAAEYSRKVRTLAGNFQLLLRHPWLLNPLTNRIWFRTVSHKFCRLPGPACLAVALAANLALGHEFFYRLLLLPHVLFYAAAAAGSLMRKPAGGLAVLNIPYSFCLLNWATVAGLLRFLRGRQRVTWQKASG